MISKNTIKLIKSLAHKKFRIKQNLFLVEGDKMVAEVLASTFTVAHLFCTNDFLNRNSFIAKNAQQISEASKDEIRAASQLKNPQNSIALCKLPDKIHLPKEISDLAIFLDGIQDPGNLGTIIRVCDWFGISNLFCSEDTVDLYNPKVIQSTMGSFCRLQTYQTSFDDVFQIARSSKIPVLGAFMNGENIYQHKLPTKALLVMGNEGNGIRAQVEEKIDKKVAIPSFSDGAESLNVAIATSIICSEFRRQLI